MRRLLIPPGTTTEVVARRVLVVAPHYDDEALGCGGLLAQLASSGAEVRVLFLTDSAGGRETVDDRLRYSVARREEAEAAAAVLGIALGDTLGLPDGGLDQQVDALAAGLEASLLEHRPDLLLVPSPLESSADHRAAFRALHDGLGGVREGSPLATVAEDLVVLAYEVNRPLYPDVLVDIGPQLEVLERALGCYDSQEAKHPYAAARLGWLRYRTLSLPPTVAAAEAYVRLRLDDFTTRSPADLVRDLGGAAELLAVTGGPALSVVVRTRDRPELLIEALQSLAASTHRPKEVVLVNDGGAPPPALDIGGLEIRRVDLETSRGRAGAANAGVEAARGDAVVFLDDDDLVAPEHLEVLGGLISGAGIRVAYTDAAVVVYRPGAAGWEPIERRLPYSRDFDPELLLFDNYIPFHTLVIDRLLFDEVGPFDEGLPFFEDWDWLIRASAVVPFHHCPRVTCEYRQFRGAGHHVLGDRPRERADFLATKARVVAKHAHRATPAAATTAVDRLRAEAVAAGDAARQARGRAQKAEASAHALNGRLAGTAAERDAVEIVRQRLAADLATKESARLALEKTLLARDAELERLYGRESELVEAVQTQGRELDATFAEIERLNQVIREMEQTRAWRLHRWWRSRRG